MTAQPTVIHVAREPRTGVWSAMRQLASWQMQHGYRVAFGLLLSRGWPDAYREQMQQTANSGVEIFEARSPGIFGTGAFLFHEFSNPIAGWSRQLASRGGPVAVHFHNAWLSGAFVPVSPKSVKTLVTYHGMQGEKALRVQPSRRQIHAHWAKRLVKHGVMHASVDRRGCQVVEELLGVPADLFTIVPNGTAFAPQGISGSPRLRDDTAPFTVGHVGIVDDGKGWQITAEAINSIYKQGYGVRFLIAGSGPQTDQAQAWCTAHADFATFLGHVDNPMVNVFPKLDVLSLPSLNEGQPMAVLEAFSMGVPVIATAVGGLPQTVENNVSGQLIERNAESVEAAILDLINNPDRHARLSNGAREEHASRFSTDVMGEAYERLYW